MLAGPLLEWWAAEGRHDLPWRHTRDPWAVLVSEVMLQQTQAARVKERFGDFLHRFPSPAATAQATAGEVIDAWSGLGYNRRAVSLHRAAAQICGHHRGRVPGTLAELMALPGVGPYTARAVLVFAFGRDLGLVDATAGRVVARALAGRPLAPAEAQAVADAAVPADRGWEWGQAVFDLGALVCRRRQPACGACPVRARCAWAMAAFAAPDPAAGSAGESGPQSPLAGSFRQGRARLVTRLRSGPIGANEMADGAGWPDDPDRAAAAAASLVRDGLAARDGAGGLRLPR